MRVAVRVLALALLAVVAFVTLGPLAPPESFLGEASVSLRRVFEAWWGFPFGLR